MFSLVKRLFGKNTSDCVKEQPEMGLTVTNYQDRSDQDAADNVDQKLDLICNQLALLAVNTALFKLEKKRPDYRGFSGNPRAFEQRKQRMRDGLVEMKKSIQSQPS